ncbi:MAG: hypothetical protein ACRDD7_10830 [Peptostreptococcaceae bacterium]
MIIAIAILVSLLVAKIIITLLKMAVVTYSMLELERDKLRLSEEVKNYFYENMKLTKQQSVDLIKITTNFKQTENKFSLKRIYDETENYFKEAEEFCKNKEG